MIHPAGMTDALAELRRAAAAGEIAEFWIENTRNGRAIFYRPSDSPRACPFPVWQEFHDHPEHNIYHALDGE